MNTARLTGLAAVALTAVLSVAGCSHGGNKHAAARASASAAISSVQADPTVLKNEREVVTNLVACGAQTKTITNIDYALQPKVVVTNVTLAHGAVTFTHPIKSAHASWLRLKGCMKVKYAGKGAATFSCMEKAAPLPGTGFFKRVVADLIQCGAKAQAASVTP